MLFFLPIDIVERIAILTGSYKDYETMCIVYERLKDPHIKKRVINAFTQRIVEGPGNVFYEFNGKIHREDDLPAIEYVDGRKEWWLFGERKRLNDKPTVVDSKGTQMWYVGDRKHRENDLPAVIGVDGGRLWYLNGLLHRDNDKPAEITRWHR